MIGVCLLGTALALRLHGDSDVDAVASELRSWAMFSGLFAFLLAGATLEEKAQEVLVARRLMLRIFPAADQTPPPVTPAARRWSPIARWSGLIVFLIAMLWSMVALVMEVAGYLVGLL